MQNAKYKPRYIEDFHGPYRMSGGQRNYRRCPICGSMGWKLYVDPETGKWICFAGACGAKGKVGAEGSVFYARDRGVPQFPAIELPKTEELTAADRRFLTRYNDVNPDHYFLRRAWEANRIVIPYADESGTFIYWIARATDDAVPKYKMMGGAHPLYVPNFVATYKGLHTDKVVLVEGPFDAMSLHGRGYDAVAMGGKALPRTLITALRNYLGGRQLVIMLDRDAVADAQRLMFRLQGAMLCTKVSMAVCPAKDPAEASTADLMEVLL